MSLRIALHREIPEDATLCRQWNDLVLQMERPEVFYTCEWALAMQSAYQALLRPLLLLGYEGDSLVGVASMATDQAERTVSFLAATTADYCEFVARPQNRASFIHRVFEEFANLNLGSITLANLPEDSATSAALRTAAANRALHLYMRPAYLCAQVDLSSGEKRHELKIFFLGKKKLRQYLRAMEREGPVKICHLQSQDEIDAALPAFADAHVARFQVTNRVSSLSSPERRRFLQELARRFSGTGVVTLSVLTVGDSPVAWNYGFRFGGSWFWYQPTFDSHYEENSPGYCLLSRIVIEACDLDGIQTVDLGLGAEGYKERFGNSTRKTFHVTATKSLSRHVREVVRYRTAAVLKESPRIETAVRHIFGRKPARQRRTPEPKSV